MEDQIIGVRAVAVAAWLITPELASLGLAAWADCGRQLHGWVAPAQPAPVPDPYTCYGVLRPPHPHSLHANSSPNLCLPVVSAILCLFHPIHKSTSPHRTRRPSYRQNAESRAVGVDPDPFCHEPRDSQAYRTNFAVVLFLMQAAKKIPFDDPNILNVCRAAYVTSNLIILGIYFYCKVQIDRKNGVPKPPSHSVCLRLTRVKI